MDKKIFLGSVLGRPVRIEHEEDARDWSIHYHDGSLWRFLVRSSVGAKSYRGVEPNLRSGLLGWSLFNDLWIKIILLNKIPLNKGSMML